MINHARTLLLNKSSSDSRTPEFPGEEYVPAGFAPITLTPQLKVVRDILFGKDPDRAMLNYRLREYMTAIHSQPLLDEHIRSLDPRLTYLPFRDTRLARPNDYAVNITQVPVGVERQLSINGDVFNLRERSRLRKVWTLEILSASTVEVKRTTVPTDSVIDNFTVSDGITSAIDLIGSPLTVYLDPTVGSKWIVEVFARPTIDLVETNTRIKRLDNTTLNGVFGRKVVEPFKTFKNMWSDPNGLGLVDTLGAFVTAVAFRMGELRKNRE